MEVFVIAAGVLIAEAVIAAFRYAWRITFVRKSTSARVSQENLSFLDHYRGIVGNVGQGAGGPLGTRERPFEAEANRVRPDGH